MRLHNRFPTDRHLVRRSMMLAGAFVFAGVIAAIVVGPATVIYWIKNLLIPGVAIHVVVVGAIGLSVWEAVRS